jgi:hypothetical protein
VKTVCNLPSEKQGERAGKQAIGVPARNENERGEHHRKIPVVYTARTATAVFHKPRLKRTEKQYAYNVAYGKRQSNQN